MSHRRSRRDLICGAALDLAAEGGNHALTHQRVDARLGLPRGSTSYYYRTRRALVSAAIAHLTCRSREQFRDAAPSAPPKTTREAASLIVSQLEALMVERRRDVLARYALMTDAAGDDELQEGLASCLFSLSAATVLMDSLGASDPSAAARDLITLLEGLVFDFAFGARKLGADASLADETETLRTSLHLWIDALVASR
ncbi:TetR family transcriptional regulator [Rhodococcus sp. WMMA185]|uniref:TetR/AcrR family transcriptional regulator n=1 Tax=Rhodococcus sp. WMMA185 TaxID=679318 RepID=UPI0008787DAC|nr:TetR family transcriptional regulator [Rhodococcus sp. WMMA185]AOW91934.1 TetR family transcriptional regulator [Rhodococcus sp. WMMA185]